MQQLQQKRRYIFDIETRGLLPGLEGPDDLFIITAIDIDTGERYAAKLDECEELARELYAADVLIGHNIFGFDLPALQKTLGWWDRLEHDGDFDTMIAGRLLWPNLFEQDIIQSKAGSTTLPKNLYGSHSLKAHGLRLGVMKDDYAGGFDSYNEEMFEYAKQDVEVTLALWDRIQADEGCSARALDLEMSVARLMARQERTGFPFDCDAAQVLLRDLTAEQAAIQARLQAAFGSWEVPGEIFTPKANNSKLGYVKGVETRKPSKTVVFNPSSRDHISNRLQTLYGWEPQAWTDGGKPKIDETVLLKLYEDKGWEVCKDLADNFMIEKRLGQLSDGNQAWLKKEQGGRIHGRVITNGAVSGRATHSNPNIAQVPGNRAPFGERCRSLFVAPEGRVLVGSDASGLELRCLAHFLNIMGDSSYAEEVVNGDVHTKNQNAAGLPSRDQAKTFIYALLYGGGAGKIGSIIGKGAQAGQQLKDRFFKNLPALGKLIEQCQIKATKKGYLLGLDGRKLHCRSPHSSLNLLLQSAGALVCKQWLIEADKLFVERSLDVQWHAWVHDEAQVSCPPDQADEVGQAFQDAMRRVQQNFNFRCQLDTDYSVGANWSETH